MKKVLCLIYPNFSLYEVVGLTSTLALSFGVEVDYASSDRNVIRTEDGLPCQPTRILDEVVIEDYSCVILPGMINIVPALHDEKLISFLKSLKQQEVLIAAISSAPILLAKAGLLKDAKFTGGIWQNFFDYFEFLPRENFKAQAVLQNKNIITAVGFAHQAFARKVLLSLGLVDNADNYFKERNKYSDEDLIFALSEEEFAEMKHEFENTL
ncbi:DJ-1/PfpI family protein [Streptococcus sanguinis]|uniref:DJ-1/PfpI family protein n=1 Tax=Streptococcus sanguinis TaxID=1305 RepID=UPI0039C132AA